MNKTKVDPKMGERIHKLLLSKGIETPMDLAKFTSEEHSKNEIEFHFAQIMELLGLDLNDDSMQGTPHRVAKMFVYEIFSGLNYDNFPYCTAVENKMNCNEMVICKDVTVNSSCEHHFVTIDGLAKVAYIPNDKVIGLSKINRIVRFFSKRPQIQERLTEQIHATLCAVLGIKDVAVEISAVHFCVKTRGIEDSNSYTTTRKLGGKFFDDAQVRHEFLNG